MKGGGIRLGGPSVTTREMREPEMEQIGGWIAEILSNIGNAEVEQRVRKQVAELAAKFPDLRGPPAWWPGAHRTRPRLAWQPHSVSSISQRPSWQPQGKLLCGSGSPRRRVSLAKEPVLLL